jgi:hypothetical protein
VTMWYIAAAWPARYDAQRGEYCTLGALQLCREDGCLECLERTEAHLRDAAQMLVDRMPRGCLARFCAISPDKTTGDLRPFPFTHHMVIDDQGWTWPREWFVALVEGEAERRPSGGAPSGPHGQVGPLRGSGGVRAPGSGRGARAARRTSHPRRPVPGRGCGGTRQP